jgi:hypothetical protein
MAQLPSELEWGGRAEEEDSAERSTMLNTVDSILSHIPLRTSKPMWFESVVGDREGSGPVNLEGDEKKGMCYWRVCI